MTMLPWDNRIMRDLKIMAEDVPPVNHARLSAALAIRGNVIAYGTNSWKSNPFQKSFSKNEFSTFWHAETNAIFNSLKRSSLDEVQRATLYVMRVKRPSEHSRLWIQALSRPCMGCRKCIYQFGILRVIYTDDAGGFVCEGE